MATLDDARRRFEAAVDRLEAAAEAAARRADADPTIAEELAAVRADRDRLAVELADLQRHHDTLRSVADAASRRLDGTIERVRALMGE
jgi:chromosome segregation ATPase